MGNWAVVKETPATPTASAPPPPSQGSDPWAVVKTAPAAPDTSQTMATPNPKGLVKPGNLQIWNRPMIQNADGTHSSELAFSMEDDNGHEVLIPSIANGRFLTPDGKMPKKVNGKIPDAEDWDKYPQWKALKQAAWARYEQTGEHLGQFDNPDDADAYANILHSRGSRPQQAAAPAALPAAAPAGQAVAKPFSMADATITGQLQYARNKLGPLGFLLDPAIATQRETAKDLVTVGDVGRGAAHLVTGKYPQQSELYKQMSELASSQPQSTLQKLAGLHENLTEFSGIEGLERLALGAMVKMGVTGTEALKGAGMLTGFAEKYPGWAAVLKRMFTEAGVQGGASAAQTALKGGDTGDVITSGVVGAGLGAAGELSSGATVRGVKHLQKPTIEGGEKLTGAARGATARTLQEVNESRALPTIDAARTLPASTEPFTFTIHGTPETSDIPTATTYPGRTKPIPYGVDLRPSETGWPTIRGGGGPGGPPGGRWQGLTDVKPGTVIDEPGTFGGGPIQTTNPDTMALHIENLDDYINGSGKDAFNKLDPASQQRLRDVYADAQSQMANYHRSLNLNAYPNFDQLDVPTITKNVNSWPQAVDAINQTHQEVFKNLDDLTGGRFTGLRNDYTNAWNDYINAGSEEQPAAARKLAKNEKDLQDMFDSIGHAVTPSELAGANQAFRNSLIVNDVSNIVENAMTEGKAGEARLINGDSLMDGLKKYEQKLGPGTSGQRRLERVIGPASRQNLYDVARENMDGRMSEYVKQLAASALAGTVGAHFLHAPWEATATGGWLTYRGGQALMHKIAVNPVWGHNIIMGAKYAVRPETVIPILSSLQAQYDRDAQQRKQQQGNQ